MSTPPKDSRFSALLLEGLDHYRKGRMMEAVRAWEEAYTLEPSNLRAREFLRSALERIHAHMAPPAAPQQAAHPWLPPATQQQFADAPFVFAGNAEHIFHQLPQRHLARHHGCDGDAFGRFRAEFYANLIR